MRTLVALAVLCTALMAAAQTVPSPQAIKELAPTGKLRVAINYVNTVIARPGPPGGDPQGISADLARELARRLGVPIEYVIFQGAGREFHAADRHLWDIGFFAIDPDRAKDVDFTSPYVEFAGGYMVPKDSKITSIADVDEPGVRVGVGKDSVYDLFLTGTFEQAELVRATPASLENVVEMSEREKLDVVAFIKLPLAHYVRTHPGWRLLPGGFMDIEQAIATPHGHGAAGEAYLRAFVQEAKTNGFLASLLGTYHPGLRIAQDADLQDAVKVAPRNFKVLEQNQNVRVVQDTLAPGEKEAMHTHPAGWYYVTQPGTMKVTYADGKSTIWEAKAGERAWMEAEPAHTSENIGTTTIQYVLVEVKSAQKPK